MLRSLGGTVASALVSISAFGVAWAISLSADAKPPDQAAVQKACSDFGVVELADRTKVCRDAGKSALSVPPCSEMEEESRIEIGEEAQVPLDLRIKSASTDAVIAFCDADARNDRDERENAYVRLLSSPDRPIKVEALGASLLSSAFAQRAIEGTAALIADRAQAELGLWLVTDFSQKLCRSDEKDPKPEPKSLDVDLWFPETCEVAQRAGEQPSGMLASAFRTDLEELPYAVLGDVLEFAGSGVDDAKGLVAVVRGTIRALRDGERFRDAFPEQLRAQSIECAATNDVSCGLALVGIIAEVSRDAAGDDGKLDRDDVLALLTQTDLQRRLREEIVAKYGPVPSDPTPFGKLVAALKKALGAADEVKRVRLAADALIGGDGKDAVIAHIRSIFLAAGALVDAVGTDPSGERRTAILLAGIDLASEVFGLATEIAGPDTGLAKAGPVVGHAASAARHFARREWQDGGRATLRLLVALPNPCESVEGEVSGGRQNRRRKTRCEREHRGQSDAIAVAIRSLTFVVDASAAETPEAFAAALDSAAAPLGGWRRKTEAFTTSVAAMAGLGFGGETLLEGRARNGAYVAPLAILGLDLAGPIVRSSTRPSSLGLFVSVIDVGQLASQRVLGDRQDEIAADEEGVEEKPKVGVAQVLSPGLFLRLGVARTPITVLAGASFAPDLRRAKDESAGSKFDAWVVHYGVGLAVDVTLFAFGKRNPARRGR